VQRVGSTHQAGSDSLITSKLFFKIAEQFPEIDFDKEKNKLFGLNFESSNSIPFNLKPMIITDNKPNVMLGQNLYQTGTMYQPTNSMNYDTLNKSKFNNGPNNTSNMNGFYPQQGYYNNGNQNYYLYNNNNNNINVNINSVNNIQNIGNVNNKGVNVKYVMQGNQNVNNHGQMYQPNQLHQGQVINGKNLYGNMNNEYTNYTNYNITNINNINNINAMPMYKTDLKNSNINISQFYPNVNNIATI